MFPTRSTKDMTTETTFTVTSDHNIFTLIHRHDIPGLQSALNNADDLNIRDHLSQTPLMHAMFISDDLIRIQMIRLLLRHGCDVNAQDNLGRTALMHACMDVEKMEVVRQLVKCRNCDPNIYDTDGNIALMHCVWNANSGAIKILTNHTNVKNRLRVNVVNRSGHSALEMAIKLGLGDCCRILLKDGEADTSRIKYHGRLFLKSLEEEGLCSNSSQPSCVLTLSQQSVVSTIMQRGGLCYRSSDRTVILASSMWGQSLDNAVQDELHENDTSSQHLVQVSSTLSKPGYAQSTTRTTTVFPESKPTQIQLKGLRTHFAPENKLCVNSGLSHGQETKPEPSTLTKLQTTSKSDTLSSSMCFKQHQSSYSIRTEKYFSRNVPEHSKPCVSLHKPGLLRKNGVVSMNLPENSSPCLCLHKPRMLRKNGVVHFKTEGEVHFGGVFWKRLPPLNRNGKSSAVTPMTTFPPLPQIPQGKIE